MNIELSKTQKVALGATSLAALGGIAAGIAANQNSGGNSATPEANNLRPTDQTSVTTTLDALPTLASRAATSPAHKAPKPSPTDVKVTPDPANTVVTIHTASKTHDAPTSPAAPRTHESKSTTPIDYTPKDTDEVRTVDQGLILSTADPVYTGPANDPNRKVITGGFNFEVDNAYDIGGSYGFPVTVDGKSEWAFVDPNTMQHAETKQYHGYGQNADPGEPFSVANITTSLHIIDQSSGTTAKFADPNNAFALDGQVQVGTTTIPLDS